MNKLGKRDYVVLISNILVGVYGETLKDHGTDVKMAEKVVEGLDDFLYFHPFDMSYNDFRKWRKHRKQLAHS